MSSQSTSMMRVRQGGRPIKMLLVAVTGPSPITIEIDPEKQYTIGRRANHSITLEHPEVSKDHASLAFQGDANRGTWMLTDTASRHGTRVNGVPLESGRACPVLPGDLIEISPWTFCLMSHNDRGTGTSRISTINDAQVAGSTVVSIQADAERDLAQERLRLLLHCAESLQRARDEQMLASIVLNAAVAGTGFANAAVTRPMTPDGETEVIVSCGAIASAGNSPRLSRTLIASAAQGVPVQLRGSSPIREAVSIAQFDIQEAICVPLMIESTVAGFLYLDHRGQSDVARIKAQEACAFAVGIGRLASMAWSNLMRLELEKRYARVEGEMSAGARAQQLILPRREGACGGLNYVGECKPGRVMSGDFFDVFELHDHRIAVIIGDVSGKGIAASVIMTTTQGFLHGALRQHGDLAKAARELNEYVNQRCEAQTFVTLWAGVFDPQQHTLTYVDAGHGYAWLVQSDGSLCKLDAAGGPPIAVAPDSKFETATVEIDADSQVLLVSDGIVEQTRQASDPDRDDQFGRARVEQFLSIIGRRSGRIRRGEQSRADDQDGVASLFEAVQSHAGCEQLSDDATIVLVKF